MAKSDSSKTEEVVQFPFQGDLYFVYHILGVVTSIQVSYDNCGQRPTEVAWTDLPAQVQQKIDDEINFGD